VFTNFSHFSRLGKTGWDGWTDGLGDYTGTHSKNLIDFWHQNQFHTILHRHSAYK
jgi:hypothetical protein